jgi:hypothetical protein
MIPTDPILTSWEDLKAGMYFEAETEPSSPADDTACFVFKKNGRAELLMFSQRKAYLMSHRESEPDPWGPPNWNRSWMSKQKPAFLNFRKRRDIFREMFKSDLRYTSNV